MFIGGYLCNPREYQKVVQKPQNTTPHSIKKVVQGW